MKNSEIHNGLPDEAIRRLLAHDIRETYLMEINNKQEIAPYDREEIQNYVIQDCKNQIKFHQQRLKIAELRKGLNMVIKMHCWEEWDVSDETTIVPGENFYLSFIGTKAEYDHLLEIINGK
jgi:hypothetical protein